MTEFLITYHDFIVTSFSCVLTGLICFLLGFSMASAACDNSLTREQIKKLVSDSVREQIIVVIKEGIGGSGG